jgi:hypothetical protein
LPPELPPDGLPQDGKGRYIGAGEAPIQLTGKYDEGGGQGALPYYVCIVLSGKLLDDFFSLKEQWRVLFEQTRKPETSSG